MNRPLQIISDKPITVYDCDTKSIIGIFKYQWIVSKYLGYQYISQVLKTKGRLHKSRFPSPVTFRYATEQQAKELGEEYVLIKDDSKLKFDYHLLKKYDSTRLALYKEHTMNVFGIKW